MNEDTTRRRRWATGLAVAVLVTLAGIIAYNVGVSHGVAQTAIAQAVSGQTPQAPIAPPPYAYPYWGWHRPWGFGFGFPFFLLFIFLWFAVFRGLFWGWGGRYWRHRYYMGPAGIPPAFDEWHRRAHEQMKEGPSADPAGRRG